MGSGNTFKRNAGILMAISSLPSPYGIGTLGKMPMILLIL